MRVNKCCITAYDISKKFVRDMSLYEAVDFLTILEAKDARVGKDRLLQNKNDGVEYSYHYIFTKRKRGEKTE